MIDGRAKLQKENRDFKKRIISTSKEELTG